jgi:hypothetical protein
MKFSKETGEIPDSLALSLNEGKIREEENNLFDRVSNMFG